MNKKLLLSAAIATGIAMQSLALPADPTPRVITQPDGSTITIVMHGDEYGGYTTTTEGEIIQRCSDGFFRYSQMVDERCVATEFVARDNDDDNAEIQQFLKQVDRNAIKEHVRKGREVRRNAMSYEARPEGAPLRKIATATSEDETEQVKKVRGLVILAEFQDVKFSENGTKENISALMNEEGNNYMGAIGSARDYFLAQSYGKFDPTFDVVGPVTLPENMAYYGAPEAGYSSRDDGSKVYYLPLHACDVAFEQGLCNFADYDSDGDNVIDLVFVIYAGYAESSGADVNTIWPHAAWAGRLSAAKERVYNGITVDAYACTSELAGIEGTDLYGIGAICHEFSHTLGLPDWYDTLGNGVFGMDKWSVMDIGCHLGDGRIPCGYNAFEREFCGWMNITELTEATSIEMTDVATSATAYKVVADNNADRYYTLETRVKEGWDQHLPGEGILIIKVDRSKSDNWGMPEGEKTDGNKVNTVNGREGFQVVPADNQLSSDNLAGDVWPNGSQNAFSDTTTPKMRIATTTIKNKPVTNMTYDSATKIATFDFMGGDSGVEGVSNDNNQIYYNGTDIVVKSNVAEASIYNIQGMKVATLTVDGKAVYTPTSKGVYIVRCGADCAKVTVL